MGGLKLDISFFSSEPDDLDFQTSKADIQNLLDEGTPLPEDTVNLIRGFITHKKYPKYFKQARGSVYLGLSTEADALFQADHVKSKDPSKFKVKLPALGTLWTSVYEEAVNASVGGVGSLEIIYTSSATKGFWLDLNPICKPFKVKAQNQVICLEPQITVQAQWSVAL